MTGNKNTEAPEIRFNGFTHAWAQQKLGEIACVVGGGTPNTANPIYWDGNIDWYSPLEIGKEIYAFSSRRKITELGLTKSSAKVLPADKTILFTSRAGIGDMAILKSPAATNQGFQSLVVNKNFDVYFIYSAGNKIKKYALKNASGSTFLEISGKSLAKMELFVPTFKEQTAIGAFFRTLDDIIVLYQRKLENLKKLKKAYLQQMFPQTGEQTPRTRFAKFTGNWEQRRLGEVVERVHGNNGRMNLPTLTISAGNGWMDQQERFANSIAGKEKENYTLLSKGELSYNKGNSKLAKYGMVFELKTHEEALVPRVYHSFRATQESNAAFLEYMFATKIPDRELVKLITSGARIDGLLNIGFEAFVGIIINIPSLSEQTAIGNFFRTLDEQITVQQTKLDKLKQLKTAFLQRMLV